MRYRDQKILSYYDRDQKILRLDIVNCARLRRPYGGLDGSVWVMGEWSVDTGCHEVSENILFV